MRAARNSTAKGPTGLNMADYSTPLGKFEQQRRQAKHRGIDWFLTFDEWTSIWEASGKWLLRGKKKGQYVMARTGDVGPYSAGNVYICLSSENHSHAHSNGRIQKRTTEQNRSAQSNRKARGWTYRSKAKSPYQVMYGNKYIGCFTSQEEAEAAYANAKACVHGAPIFFHPTDKH